MGVKGGLSKRLCFEDLLKVSGVWRGRFGESRVGKVLRLSSFCALFAFFLVVFLPVPRPSEVI